MKKILIPTLLILPILCSCSSVGEDVERLDDGLGDVRKIQAEHTTDISEIREEVRKLSGKLDELLYDQEQRIGGGLNNVQQELQDLKRRVPPPASVPATLLEQDEAIVGSLEPGLGRDFGNALSMVRAGNFKTAATYIDEAMLKDVDRKVSPLLLYWRGVSLENLQDYKGALLAYNDLVSAYAKHPRAADALLQQGIIFQRQGEAGLAKVTFQKLISDFPGSDASAAAKARISG